MDIFLNNAILHIINNDKGENLFSDQELDIDSDICSEFISKHIKKLMDNPASKEATFNADSKVYNTIQDFKNGNIFFKDASNRICEHLSEIMMANCDIPPADILIAQFEIKDNPYIVILKLNYKECYTHETSGSDNQIIKYRSVLPFDSGKVEEACLIPYNPMLIKVLEKPYLVNGEPVNYFSKLFLDCAAELSKKEAVQIINEITDEISKKYFNEDIETVAKIKVALIEEAIEEEGEVRLENVANKVFGENIEIKNEYIEMAREAGIRADLNLGEKFSKQQFSMQKFKANNGIEVKFPTELSDDPNIIEFINNSDGSISIMLKNLRKN